MLGTGELIQSIEGPVAKVFDLLQRQSAPDVFASAASRTPPEGAAPCPTPSCRGSRSSIR